MSSGISFPIDTVSEEPIYCPECGSPSVDMWGNTYSCMDCHNEWNAE